MNSWRRTLLFTVVGSCIYGLIQGAAFFLMITAPFSLRIFANFSFGYNLIVPLISILIVSAHSLVKNYRVFTWTWIDVYPLLGFLIVSGALLLFSLTQTADTDFGFSRAFGLVFALQAGIYGGFLVLKYAALLIRDKGIPKR